ncbi:MAG TPA: hypothetical protein VG389_29155, partial [Myxococcota bacterium]|nr:hypothetical protein [Myxococcota bacterium]
TAGGGASAGAARPELPLTIQGAIQSRLDHLPADEKDLLKRAAVFEERFWSEALVAMGVPDPAPLLARLRRRDLVAPRPGSTLGGQTEWCFRQALVRDVACGMLTGAQREALHRAAAAWLEGLADGAPEAIAAQLDAAGDGAAAAPWWVRAVEAADARGDSEGVLAHSERALPHVGDPDLLFKLHDLRYLANYYLGRVEAQDESMRALEALAGRAKNVADRRSKRRRGHYLRRRGQIAEVLAFYEADLVQARAAGDAVWEVLALSGLGGTMADAGRPAEGQVHTDRAVELARRVGDPFYVATAAEGCGYTAGVTGDAMRAYELYREAARLYDATGDVRRAATARSNAGVSLMVFAAWGEAKRELEASLIACTRLGLLRTRGYALANLSQAYANLGDFAAARAAADESIAVADRTKEARLRVAARYHRALVQQLAGDHAGARADLQAALADPLAGPMEADMRTLLALGLLAEGDARGALAEARRAVDLREQSGALEFLAVEMYLCAFDALAALGRPAEARPFATRAADLVRRRAATMNEATLRGHYLAHPPHARALQLDGEPAPPAAGAAGA